MPQCFQKEQTGTKDFREQKRKKKIIFCPSLTLSSCFFSLYLPAPATAGAQRPSAEKTQATAKLQVTEERWSPGCGSSHRSTARQGGKGVLAGGCACRRARLQEAGERVDPPLPQAERGSTSQLDHLWFGIWVTK